MKICDGKKKRPVVSDLPVGAVFKDTEDEDAYGELFMVTDEGTVMLTGDNAGTAFCRADFGDDAYEVAAVYPNACINPGEPE